MSDQSSDHSTAEVFLCECCERPRGEDAFIGAEGEDICARCAAELLGAERDSLRQQLREAEAVVYALCDAWGGDSPSRHLDDPDSVVEAVWLDAAGYHAKYQMADRSGASDEGQRQ